MTLTNVDASTITRKNTQKALFAWKSANNALVALGKSVLEEQPGRQGQSLSIVIERQQGECKCNADASGNPYSFNGLSSCGCGNGL
jgi:hypothetical protein